MTPENVLENMWKRLRPDELETLIASEIRSCGFNFPRNELIKPIVHLG